MVESKDDVFVWGVLSFSRHCALFLGENFRYRFPQDEEIAATEVRLPLCTSRCVSI